MYTQAPGEAEAELAQLNANHIIDAVLTEDSDTFVFGATHIIRKSVISKLCFHIIFMSCQDSMVMKSIYTALLLSKTPLTLR